MGKSTDNLFFPGLYEKFETAEKVGFFNMNDLIGRALEEVKSISARKVALVDIMGEYWVVSSWRLQRFNPTISFKQAFLQKKDIFERAKAISDKNSSDEIISYLYKYSGLIVFEGEIVKGFVSLSDFSESELKLLRNISINAKLENMAKDKDGLLGISLHDSYEGINLSGADLRGADLTQAIFIKANLTKAELSGSNLTNANFTEAKLVRAKFTDANLRNSILKNADLRNAELWRADLEGADLEGANLKDAVLFRANLKSANLKGADLSNAGLMSANLEGADLSNANIKQAKVDFVIFDENTNMSNVDIDSMVIDNLGETAMKAIWDPYIKEKLKEKFG